MIERKILWALAGALFCLAAGGARAADDLRDLPAIEAAVKTALEKTNKGDSLSWRNPETGNAGTITMLRSLFRDGKPCRAYKRTLEKNGAVQESVDGIGCRTSAGGWSLQTGKSAAPATGQARTNQPSSSSGSLLTPAALPPASAQHVPAGETEYVNVWAYRTPPGQTRDDLFIKDNVFSQEMLETHPEGGALHVALLDGAEIRLGANCSVRLDEFLFDPASGTGKVTASLGRGVARFITGAVKGDNFQVRTPTALIGVRGTDFIVGVAASGATTVHVISGLVRMTLLRIGTAVMINAGRTLRVAADGIATSTSVAPPSDPGLADVDEDHEEASRSDQLRRTTIPGIGAGSRMRTPVTRSVRPPTPPPAPPNIPKITH